MKMFLDVDDFASSSDLEKLYHLLTNALWWMGAVRMSPNTC